MRKQGDKRGGKQPQLRVKEVQGSRGEERTRHSDSGAQNESADTPQSSKGPPEEGNCAGGGAGARKDEMSIALFDAQIKRKPSCAQASEGEGQVKAEELQAMNWLGKQKQIEEEGSQRSTSAVRQLRLALQVVEAVHASNVEPARVEIGREREVEGARKWKRSKIAREP